MFDAVTLAAVADELNEKILHGRVQEIVELDALSFGFEIYSKHKRHYLFATARPDEARIHLVSYRIRGSGEAPSPLRLLLQKYAENALIDAITQLPNERVLTIQFDHSAEGISTLIIEAIGRYSNLILLGADGAIMDAAKHVTANISRTRVILPRQKYSPPPPQSKLDPSALTAPKLARLLEENRGEMLWQTLVKTIAGMSPLLAREIEFRVGTDARAEKVLAIFKQLSHAPWEPSVASEDGEPAAFAPYALKQYANTRAFDSISAAIEAFYGAEEPYAALKETLHEQIAGARDKLARKRDSLAQSLPHEEAVERLKTNGELILAYAAKVRAGAKKLKVESESGIVEIALEPKLSAVENAQKYFREYRRAKDALGRVPALLQMAQVELDYVEQVLNDLDLAENRAEIEAVVQSARDAGLIAQERKGRAQIALSEPRVVESRDGFMILVGKNARQNEEITFKRAKPDDLWLHARNVAGAHVVIVGAGRAVPESTIELAAQLAAQYSQARSESRVDVIVTERKNVRRMRGGKPGMVNVKGERVVRIENE